MANSLTLSRLFRSALSSSRLSFILFAFGVTSPSFAVPPASAESQSSATVLSPFTLTGKVSTINGAEIEGASLKLYAYTGDHGNPNVAAIAETTSSQTGEYSISGTIVLSKKNPSLRMLQISKEGYVRLMHVVYEFAAASEMGYDISIIRRDVVLPVEAVIEGKITNENGEPLPGILLQGNASKAVKEAVVADTAITTSSATGEFRLDGLPEGPVKLSASLGERTLLNTSTTAPVSGLHLQVTTAVSTIAGAVVLQDGTPVPGAEVLLQRATELDSSGFRTEKINTQFANEQGQFLFGDLSPGNYKLTPRVEGLHAVPQPEGENFGFFPIASAETTSGIRLEMYSGTVVTGTVREADSGKPLTGVNVYWGDPAVNPHIPHTLSGEDGKYRLQGVIPDSSRDARLYATAEGYVLRSKPAEYDLRRWADADAAAYKTVKIPAGATTLQADLELLPSRAINGTVYDETRTPMPGVDIFVGKMWQARDRQKSGAVTDANGQFSVDAGPEKGLLLFASAKGRPVVALPAPEVGDAQTTVTITVNPPATVTGMVLTPDGQPAGNTHIQVDRNGPSHITGMASNLPPAMSGPDGTFKIEDLPAAAISLHAQKETYVPSDFERLELKPGEMRSGVTLRLGKGYIIEGRITDDAGKPVVDARVSVDAANGEKPIFANTQSGLDGTYKLTGVPDVPVNIKFWAPRLSLNGELKNIRPSAGSAQNIVLR